MSKSGNIASLHKGKLSIRMLNRAVYEHELDHMSHKDTGREEVCKIDVEHAASNESIVLKLGIPGIFSQCQADFDFVIPRTQTFSFRTAS